MDGAQSFIRNGRAQNDLDMNHHRLLNLDTSNLPPSGIPPTIVPPAHNWLNGWDSPSQTWSAAQPDFRDISGIPTTEQQRAITQLGTVRVGLWQATPSGRQYVPTLDASRAPVTDVRMNQKKLINLADPVDPQDAVNKRFMDFLLTGLNPKLPVRVVQSVRGSNAGLIIVDDVQLVEGDRVLVVFWDGVEEKQNGIYVAHAGAWTRSTDADTGTEINRAYCTVMEGTVNGGTSWVEVANVVNIGTDPVTFILFSSGSGRPIDGAGLQY